MIAGAGSGKTRVLTARVARLLEQGVAPVRRSSRSPSPTARRARCASGSRAWSGTKARSLWVGTFHATAVRILRRESRALGVPPGFAIYDRQDQEAWSTRVIAAARAAGGRVSNRRRAGADLDAKNALVSPEQMARAAVAPYERAARRGYALYQEALRKNAAFDFDDLIAEPVAPVRAHAEVGARYRTALPARPGRRVPGHQPRAVPAGARAGSASTATCAWSATTTSRSTAGAAPTSRTSSSSSTTFPGGAR